LCKTYLKAIKKNQNEIDSKGENMVLSQKLGMNLLKKIFLVKKTNFELGRKMKRSQ